LYLQCFEQDALVYVSQRSCIPLVQLLDDYGWVREGCEYAGREGCILLGWESMCIVHHREAFLWRIVIMLPHF
jgi:hypothetical protein